MKGSFGITLTTDQSVLFVLSCIVWLDDVVSLAEKFSIVVLGFVVVCLTVELLKVWFVAFVFELTEMLMLRTLLGLNVVELIIFSDNLVVVGIGLVVVEFIRLSSRSFVVVEIVLVVVDVVVVVLDLVGVGTYQGVAFKYKSGGGSGVMGRLSASIPKGRS